MLWKSYVFTSSATITKLIFLFLLQEIMKEVVENFKKEQYNDSTIYPSENAVLIVLQQFFSPAENGSTNLISLCNLRSWI